MHIYRSKATGCIILYIYFQRMELAETRGNNGSHDAKVADSQLETSENRSNSKEKGQITKTMVKKVEKGKVVQSRKHSVRSSLVKPLNIAKGETVMEIEKLLEDFLQQNLPVERHTEEAQTSGSHIRLTKQEKKDKNRERRRISRAKRESLKDFKAPKPVIFGFSCVVKKINRGAIKAVLVDPQLPQILLQILHSLALEKNLRVLGIVDLGLLTKKVLGFKVSVLGLCHSEQADSGGLYCRLLENVLEVKTCEMLDQNCHYQETKLE